MSLSLANFLKKSWEISLKMNLKLDSKDLSSKIKGKFLFFEYSGRTFYKESVNISLPN